MILGPFFKQLDPQRFLRFYVGFDRRISGCHQTEALSSTSTGSDILLKNGRSSEIHRNSRYIEAQKFVGFSVLRQVVFFFPFLRVFFKININIYIYAFTDSQAAFFVSSCFCVDRIVC